MFVTSGCQNSRDARCEMLFLRLDVERLEALEAEHVCYRRVDATYKRHIWWPLTGTTVLGLFAKTLGWNRFDHVCVEPHFVPLSQSRLAPKPVKAI